MNAKATAGDATTKHRTTVEHPSDRELLIRRTFNGPARIVYDAHTRPELLKQWWAPRSRGVTLFECEADVRVGGGYRYVFGRSEKERMVFSGTYVEVVPNVRLVYTQVFEQMRQAGEVTVTITFEEQEGRTHVVMHERYPSREALEGALSSGMEDGFRESLEQLDALLATLHGATTPIARDPKG